MQLSELQQHLKTLVTLDEAESGVISCYLKYRDGSYDRAFFQDRMKLISAGLTPVTRRALEESREQIEAYVNAELDGETRGVAVFARGGAHPFFLGLEFAVPFENWVGLSSTPQVYQLVRLKDNYDRYIVLLCTSERAKILEVNLGSVTKQLWKERPKLRERMGREWTQVHYQNHKRERNDSFLREMIRVLDQLMLSGSHTHLVLAGNPNVTFRIRDQLPKHLQSKLVDIVRTSEEFPRVVADTLGAFLKKEEEESQDVARLMISEFEAQGLAVAGAPGSYRALVRGQADVLVLAAACSLDIASVCPICLMIAQHPSPVCPRCMHREMKPMNLKQEMVRLAEEHDCKVEVVEHLPALMAYDGVGCLLRYRVPEEFQPYPQPGVE